MTVEGFSTPYLLHTVRAVRRPVVVGIGRHDQQRRPRRLDAAQRRLRTNDTAIGPGAELDFRLREGSRERRQARVAVSGTSASIVGEGPLGRSKRGSWLVSGRQSLSPAPC
jgi:hypothetical protein